MNGAPTTAPDLTVAVCTWNGAERIGATLDSLAALEPPSGVRHEVLVVDNASTDRTSAVLSGYAQRLPLRVVQEPVVGLSHARNRAVAEARGRYLLWTDDDVTVAPDWLAAYWAAFCRHPEAAIFGGPILPLFAEPGPPRWIRNNLPRLRGTFALRDLGPQEQPLTPDPERTPYGANYAVRLAEQRTVLYDPDLGRRGMVFRGGEETEVLLALLQAGGKGWWVPGARVWHRIPRTRQKRAYVAARVTSSGYRREAAQAVLHPRRRAVALATRWVRHAVLAWLTRPAAGAVHMRHLRAAAKVKGRLAARLGRPPPVP